MIYLFNKMAFCFSLISKCSLTTHNGEKHDVYNKSCSNQLYKGFDARVVGRQWNIG